MNVLNKYQEIGGKIVSNSDKFTIFIRFLAILFVPLYVLSLYSNIFEWYPSYTFVYFVQAFFHYLYYGIILNFGLYFITTKRAKKYKITATVFYLPTIIISPFFIGPLFDSYGAIFFYMVAICLLAFLSVEEVNGRV